MTQLVYEGYSDDPLVTSAVVEDDAKTSIVLSFNRVPNASKLKTADFHIHIDRGAAFFPSAVSIVGDTVVLVVDTAIRDINTVKVAYTASGLVGQDIADAAGRSVARASDSIPYI